MIEQNNYGIDQNGPNSYYDAIPTIRPKQVGMGYVPQIETVDWNFPVTVREVVSMGIDLALLHFSLKTFLQKLIAF